MSERCFLRSFAATLVCIRRIAPAQLKFKAVGFEHLKAEFEPLVLREFGELERNRSLRETLG
jgi:hypothetical protein